MWKMWPLASMTRKLILTHPVWLHARKPTCACENNRRKVKVNERCASHRAVCHLSTDGDADNTPALLLPSLHPKLLLPRTLITSSLQTSVFIYEQTNRCLLQPACLLCFCLMPNVKHVYGNKTLSNKATLKEGKLPSAWGHSAFDQNANPLVCSLQMVFAFPACSYFS